MFSLVRKVQREMHRQFNERRTKYTAAINNAKAQNRHFLITNPF